MDSESEELSIWELRRGETVLARIEEYDRDFPWVFCRIQSFPDFEPFRDYFLRNDGQWRGRTDELHKAIAADGIYLITTDGHRASAFTLSLVDDDARITFTFV